MPMEIVPFGRALIDQHDLDPVYVVLERSSMGDQQRRRWLLAYWCCYHVGVSSALSERAGREFWDGLMAMAANAAVSPLGGRWPRGRERRHFRGKVAINAVDTLRRNFAQPEAVVDHVNQPGNYREVRDRVMTLPLFGPWIAFKVADMLERLLGTAIDFTEADVLMFDQPRKAAILLAQLRGLALSDDEAVRHSANDLLSIFKTTPAPPRGERMCNIQEVETILCKWKSHYNGHYPIGNDVREIRHALAEWGEVSDTASTLLAIAPAEQTLGMLW